MQAGFQPSQLELKGWGDCDNVCGTVIDANGVSDLVARVKAYMPASGTGRVHWRTGPSRFAVAISGFFGKSPLIRGPGPKLRPYFLEQY